MSTTIQVSNTDELREAFELLSHTPGGGEIVLTPEAEGMDIVLNGGGGGEPVSISSIDPENPVQIAQIYIKDVENIQFSDMIVDSEGKWLDSWQSDFIIHDSTGLEFTNMVFHGSAETHYDPDDPNSEQADGMGGFRDCDDILFADNHISGYFHGLGVSHSSNVTVIGNEITGMQGDGLRLVGVTDLQVVDNHIHDFLGSTTEATHTDLIQMWSTGAETVSSNVLISGNLLDIGNAPACQSIFIRNEQLEQMDYDPDYYYQNITITDNTIYNGHVHGIALRGTRDAEISNNTVLWSENETNVPPEIRVGQLEGDITITNNIAAAVRYGGPGTVEGNLEVNYTSPEDPNYISNHFLNAEQGKLVLASDIHLRPDSPYADAGSDATQPLLASDDGVVGAVLSESDPEEPSLYSFDARFTVDEDGFVDATDYMYLWSFSDGTQAEGLQAVHDFGGPGEHSATLTIVDGNTVVDVVESRFEVPEPDFFELTFEGGSIADSSTYDADMTSRQLEFDDSETGTGVRIGGSTYVGASRDNGHFNDLHSFGLSFDMAIDAGSDGRFLQFMGVLQGYIDDNGVMVFELSTDEGKFVLDSGDLSLNDGQTHDIALGYSNDAGQLSLMVDGDVVSQIDASGVTAPATSYHMLFGSLSNSGVDAVLDNIKFGLHPEDAGVFFDGGDGGPTVTSSKINTLERQVLPSKSGAVETPEVLPSLGVGQGSGVDDQTPAAPETPEPAAAPVPASDEARAEATPEPVAAPEPVAPVAPAASLGDGGATPDPAPAAEADNGGGGGDDFLTQFFETLLALFGINIGGGSDNDAGPAVAAATPPAPEPAAGALLSDLVPVIPAPEPEDNDDDADTEAEDNAALGIAA